MTDERQDDLSTTGSVFVLSLSDGREGVGHVVQRLGGPSHPFFAAIHDGLLEGAAIDEVLRRQPVLLALTMDEFLFHGRWRLVDRPLWRPKPMALPAYRLDVGKSSEVVDHAGRRYKADTELARRLPYETVVAATRLDSAFRALHGEGEWEAAFDGLRPPAWELTSDAIFGKASNEPFEDLESEAIDPDEHQVATHLPLTGDDYGTWDERDVVQQLGRSIDAQLQTIGGTHDGHEFGNGEAVMFSYGPDADQILEIVKACLEDVAVPRGAFAIKRYGPAGDSATPRERVDLR